MIHVGRGGRSDGDDAWNSTGVRMNKLEQSVEKFLFFSRWILAPFFVGLVVAMLALLVRFCEELIGLLTEMVEGKSTNVLIPMLAMVDSALIASLLLIIVLSGYENFVSKLDIGEHVDRPVWMGAVGFSDLKIKLLGAIVAISAVELLRAFIDLEHYTNEQLAWKTTIHFTFVVSGVLYAITDRIAEGKARSGEH
jgi:uncharacterized protein (TIGR00645 family)